MHSTPNNKMERHFIHVFMDLIGIKKSLLPARVCLVQGTQSDLRPDRLRQLRTDKCENYKHIGARIVQ